MSPNPQDTPQLSRIEKVAAIAGGAVVFTVVAYGTRRLLRRLFDDEPERVVVVVRDSEVHAHALALASGEVEEDQA